MSEQAGKAVLKGLGYHPTTSGSGNDGGGPELAWPQLEELRVAVLRPVDQFLCRLAAVLEHGAGATLKHLEVCSHDVEGLNDLIRAFDNGCCPRLESLYVACWFDDDRSRSYRARMRRYRMLVRRQEGFLDELQASLGNAVAVTSDAFFE